MRVEERGDRKFYALTCPLCGDGYEHQIKPRGRDPRFVEEFSAQIRLVAFDMLVNHLLGEHEGLEGLAPTAPEPEAPPPPVAGPEPGLGPAWLLEARRAAAERGEGRSPGGHPEPPD